MIYMCTTFKHISVKLQNVGYITTVTSILASAILKLGYKGHLIKQGKIIGTQNLPE